MQGRGQVVSVLAAHWVNLVGTNGGLTWPGEGRLVLSGGRLAGRGMGCTLQGVALQLALLGFGAGGGRTSPLCRVARYLGHLAAGLVLRSRNLRKRSVHLVACSPCGRLSGLPAPAWVLHAALPRGWTAWVWEVVLRPCKCFLGGVAAVAWWLDLRCRVSLSRRKGRGHWDGRFAARSRPVFVTAVRR